jgi:predicted nucleotidyltransferase
MVFAYVFGSYATSECREDSDIDETVYTRKPLGWGRIC